MSTVIRFHFDEHIHTAIAVGLRRRGIDVTTTADAGLIGASDKEHLAVAFSENRVVTTSDEDFLRLHSQGIDHSGIIYCQQGSRSVGDILHNLIFLYECCTAEDMYGQVEYI